MSNDSWSPEEERFLKHEAFIAEVIKQRAENDPNPEPKSLFRLLNSTGGTALITVLLGSLLAPIVISSIASSNARNDQALSEYKQHLQLQQEAVKETYSLIGRMTYAAQDLITITKPIYDVRSAAPNDQAELEKQKRQMITNYNDTIREWRMKENIQGVLISYYFNGHRSVSDSWVQTEKALNEFIECAQKTHEEFLQPQTDSKSEDCQPKKEAIAPALNQLSESITASRQYTWQQLDIPSHRLAEPQSPPQFKTTPKVSP